MQICFGRAQRQLPLESIDGRRGSIIATAADFGFPKTLRAPWTPYETVDFVTEVLIFLHLGIIGEIIA